MTATTTTPPRRSGSPTLAQIVAVVQGVKTRTEKALTAAHHLTQRPQPFVGITRIYQPRDEDGEPMPAETAQIQARVPEIIQDVATTWARMVDVVATQDVANCQAFGDIVIDGEVLLAHVPVTHLMWLEKQVINLRTFITKLPVLDIAQTWTWNPDVQGYETLPVQTTRTKKQPRNHVKAPATDKHQAQVDVWMEDVVVGYWTRIDYSGAIPTAQVLDMAERVEKLLDAVRFAREQANQVSVTDFAAGTPLVQYVFSPSTEHD